MQKAPMENLCFSKEFKVSVCAKELLAGPCPGVSAREALQARCRGTLRLAALLSIKRLFSILDLQLSGRKPDQPIQLLSCTIGTTRFILKGVCFALGCL